MRKQTLHPRTAVINQKQKNQSKKSRLNALHWLQEKFPAAFDNRLKIQPLKLGIMSDILAYADDAAAVGISKSKLREAVVLFTRRLDYLVCLKAREMRVDLLGNPVALVSEEDAEHAALKMKKRVEKSVKNARKLISSLGPEHQKRTKIYTSDIHEQAQSECNGSPFMTSAAPRVMPVTVTHKQSRTYDPVAVARLKKKLGISQKLETGKE